MGSAVRKSYYDFEEKNIRINHFERSKRSVRNSDSHNDLLKSNRKKNRKKAEITQLVDLKVDSFFKSLSYIVLTVAVFSMIILGGYKFVNRYAEINMKQREISIIKKSINSMNKKMDLVIMQRENSISMKELEKYATEELDMIKPDLGNKLVVDEVISSRLKAEIQFGKNRSFATEKVEVKYRGGL